MEKYKFTPSHILVLLSVIGLVLASFGVSLGSFHLVDLSLAVFAASFLL